MTAREILLQILAYSELNTQQLSVAIGAKTKQSLYDILNGKTKSISKPMASKIISYLPDINESWLLTGKGEMLIDAAADSGRSNTQLAEPRQVNKGDEVMMSTVPLVPVGAFGGKVSGFYEEGVALEDCERVPCPVHGCDIAIDVSGESMAPDFPNGCRVFCRKIHEEAFIAWGNTFVLDTVNGPFIKNIFDAGDGRIEARSINPDFPPFYIPKNSVFGIYRVMFVGKSFAAM